MQFQRTYEGQIDTWNYRWMLNCWLQNGLTALPNVNLVSNIGFGEDGTNARASASVLANIPVQTMQFPLQAPTFVIRDVVADKRTENLAYFAPERPWLERQLSRIKKRIGRLRNNFIDFYTRLHIEQHK
jgi:hypothetical protein